MTLTLAEAKCKYIPIISDIFVTTEVVKQSKTL